MIIEEELMLRIAWLKSSVVPVLAGSIWLIALATGFAVLHRLIALLNDKNTELTDTPVFGCSLRSAPAKRQGVTWAKIEAKVAERTLELQRRAETLAGTTNQLRHSEERFRTLAILGMTQLARQLESLGRSGSLEKAPAILRELENHLEKLQPVLADMAGSAAAT
jgi:hypothetical protein